MLADTLLGHLPCSLVMSRLYQTCMISCIAMKRLGQILPGALLDIDTEVSIQASTIRVCVSAEEITHTSAHTTGGGSCSEEAGGEGGAQA